MQTFLQRSIWLAVWAATMAITFWICADMAQNQPILLSIIVLCTIVMSVALVYMRIHWRDQNKTSAGAALFVGILCLGVTIVSEVSYWSSTIEGMHEHIQREKALQGGQDLVKERRRAQLAQSVGGKLPAQIKAEIATAANRAELVALKAQLSAAEELEKLQGQVIADSTSTVNFSIKRSFYEAAALGSENLGGDVKAWIFGIVALLVGCMLSLHLLSLYIGFAPKRHVEALGRQEVPPATLTLKEVSSPVLEALRNPERDLIAEEVLRLRDMPVTPQLTKVVTPPEDPDPKGGRGPILPPSAEVGQPAKEASGPEPLKQAPAARLVVDNDLPEFITKGSKGFKKKEKRLEGNVIRWIAECTSQTPDKRVKATSQECRRSYVAWCKVNGFEEIGHKKMSRIMSAELRRGDQAGRGPRNGKGAVFPGLVVYQPAAEPLRRRA